MGKLNVRKKLSATLKKIEQLIKKSSQNRLGEGFIHAAKRLLSFVISSTAETQLRVEGSFCQNR